MTYNLVRVCDLVPVPWRNGGGMTRELAVSPTDGEWNWRMSLAEATRMLRIHSSNNFVLDAPKIIAVYALENCDHSAI